MLNSKIKTITKILMIMLVLSVIIALPTIAANSSTFDGVSIENGKFVGINAALGATEYAYVTIEDYDFTGNDWSTTIDSARFTTYNGSENLTENGVVLLRLKSDTSTSATFYVDGKNYVERSEIGKVVTNGTHSWLDYVAGTNWVTGKWSGRGAAAGGSFVAYAPYNYVYYFSELGGSHTGGNYREAYFKNPNFITNRLNYTNFVKSAGYKYAYESHEIIPIDELYTISYASGVRQGSMTISSKSNQPLQTKTVVYTLTPAGEMVAHTWTDITAYKVGGYTDHTIAIADAFPTATGCVMGFEILPYGDLPSDTVFTEGASFTSTCFGMEFKPGGYTTKYKNENMVIPFQYNGINSLYIKGYADGTFRPDAKINKAEISTILARLLLSSETMPKGYLSSFADVTVDAWYHDAVAFLESNNAYSYISGTKLYPEENITRGELAALIFSTSKLLGKDAKNIFSDVDETNEYYDAIITLSDIGVINGYGDGTFRPNATVSRAEAVTMINRLINLYVSEKTVDKGFVNNKFSDIDGHWAEYQVIMASNNNVKTKAMTESNSCLQNNDTTIVIETNHVRITIQKELARVIEIYNKATGENVVATTLTPWFATLVSAGNIAFNPRYADVVDDRLEIEFSNGEKAYFIVESYGDYFTIQLDSNLPFNSKHIDFGILNVNCAFSNSDTETYRLSAVSMTTTLNTLSRPGGSTKKSVGRVLEAVGTPIGAKMAIVFSKYGGQINGEHRKYLKTIQASIDPAVGVTSTKGGAFTYDIGADYNYYNDALFYDYVIQSGGLTPDNATETAQMAKKYSIEILDLHQGSLFRQGDFSFTCAQQTGDPSFISGALFKERIADKIHAEGVLLSLHTYSAMISTSATSITTNPKWQKQIAYHEENTLTLASALATAKANATSTMYVNEDFSNMTIPQGQSGKYTGYYLIDEEIVSCQGTRNTDKKYIKVTRGCFGTTPTEHKAGSVARQLGCYYGGLQPEPGSELFYYIAELTGKAIAEADFDMIYLDGFESIGHFVDDPSYKNYFYSEFIRVLLENCGDKKPMMEGSDNPVGMWAARGKTGAVDHANRQYKKYHLGHMSSNVKSVESFQTATLGWFHYAPDKDDTYKNMTSRTLFRDDLDLLGLTSVAYNMSTVLQPFSKSAFDNSPQLVENWEYYNVYSRLREGYYFSDAVKEALKAGFNAGKEYQIFDNNGKWAFREMYYDFNIIRDMADNTFVTGSATNSYEAQTPYIRIEQRYSALPDAAETVLVDLDNVAMTYDASSKKVLNDVAKYYVPTTKNLSSKRAIKVKITGNGSATDALLISLKESASSTSDRIDHFIPLNFTGEREFILMDADNAEYAYDGYSFSGFTTWNTTNYETYRNTPSVSSIGAIQIARTGNCTGVVVGDIRACANTNAPAKNPNVTIGESTMTFNTTLNSGEYIEYLPSEGKAYRNYYNGNKHAVEEITFSGSVTAPKGDFTYTYGATSTTAAPLRAKVVIGLQGGIIENEATWTAPKIEIPENAIKLGA